MVIVSHGDVIRAGLLFALGMPLDFHSRIEVGLASLSTIRLDGSGIRVLALNDRPRLPSEAREGGLGGGDPGQVGAVGGREEIGRAGLAGEEQAVVDRGGEHRAVIGVAGKRVGVGTARPRVLQPGGRGERRDLRRMSLPKSRASSSAAKENIAACPSRSSAAANRPPKKQ